MLNKHNVEFICQSYDKVIPKESDFVYLDPPYANTTGMYYGTIDYNKFWDWIRNLKCDYLLSFDGKTSNRGDNTYDVPKDIYSKHEYLCSGNSGFRRMNRTSNNTIVYESLYVKME